MTGLLTRIQRNAAMPQSNRNFAVDSSKKYEL